MFTLSLDPTGALLFEGLGYPLRIPPTVAGLECLIQILSAQSSGIKGVGTAASPTQWDINRLLKEYHAKQEFPITEEFDL